MPNINSDHYKEYQEQIDERTQIYEDAAAAIQLRISSYKGLMENIQEQIINLNYEYKPYLDELTSYTIDLDNIDSALSTYNTQIEKNKQEGKVVVACGFAMFNADRDSTFSQIFGRASPVGLKMLFAMKDYASKNTSGTFLILFSASTNSLEIIRHPLRGRKPHSLFTCRNIIKVYKINIININHTTVR